MIQTLKTQANGQTHVGRVRSVNQDAFLSDPEAQVFIVADGMGGHAGGEIASKMCVSSIIQFLNEQASDLEMHTKEAAESKALAILSDAVNYASAKIYEYALEEPQLKGMGTTATLFKLIGNKAYCAHVGDSRMYLIRSGFIYQMTNDHSLVSEQVRAGILTPEEAKNHHLKNVITRSVGYQEDEDVDTNCFELIENDMILLCSDGLHGKINDQEIAKIVIEKKLDAIDSLIQCANDRGGEDNITALLIEFKLENGP